tara:strand:+ start:1177 stop:1470 length:294 start_codon:yes stop_codon:yes gene_type:complete
MSRRPRVDPLSAQSRTLAVTSAGDLQTLKSDFQSDKSIKDTKIANLETDKASKDTRMNNAETKLTTLENTAVGIVDGGRAGLNHVEATPINGGSASL